MLYKVLSLLAILLMFCGYSMAAESEFENLAALKSQIARRMPSKRAFFRLT
ncbi:hypothetical protein U14_01569 [Candidatus Moduliflexus flocculans]|uniref:Uncharacterized protein n=1 Tax=Candidatus Moduliflexus flocculans TaxID=1499966 RepID=A0A0S6VSG1_9BACT|nr:hypothetical protein U14_01569 [Candidatus Moduliflexus flocculans]